MSNSLVRIVRAKGGYRVQTFGENGEMLSNTEVLKQKQSAFANISAQITAFGSIRGAIVLDESTGKKYLVYQDGAMLLI